MPSGDRHDLFAETLLVRLNGEIGAKRRGHFEPMSVPAQSTDDDPVGAGGFCRNDAGQPLLPRSLNENCLTGSCPGGRETSPARTPTRVSRVTPTTSNVLSASISQRSSDAT